MVPLDKRKTYNDREEIKKMGAKWNGRFMSNEKYGKASS